jgi:1-acyl-sn-glycerol-3-phosphate acyltransferase
MNPWPLLASTIYHGLRLGTLTSVRTNDEGGLADLHHQGPILIVANHQSHADTAVLFAALPAGARQRVRFVASATRFTRAARGAPWKERIERWFLNRMALRAYRAVLVGGDESGLKAVEMLSGALRSGAVLVLYPEGTRSRDGTLGKLKPGVAMLALSMPCKVVPVRLDGVLAALPKARRFPRLRSRIVIRVRPSLVPREGETHHEFLGRVAAALAPDRAAPSASCRSREA